MKTIFNKINYFCLSLAFTVISFAQVKTVTAPEQQEITLKRWSYISPEKRNFKVHNHSTLHGQPLMTVSSEQKLEKYPLKIVKIIYLLTAPKEIKEEIESLPATFFMHSDPGQRVRHYIKTKCGIKGYALNKLHSIYSQESIFEIKLKMLKADLRNPSASSLNKFLGSLDNLVENDLEIPHFESIYFEQPSSIMLDQETRETISRNIDVYVDNKGSFYIGYLIKYLAPIKASEELQKEVLTPLQNSKH